MNFNFRHILIFSTLILFYSCVPSKQYSQDGENYRSDLRINSKYHEFDPVVNGNDIYLLAEYNINGKKYTEALKTTFRDGDTYDIVTFNKIYDGMIPTSSPSVYFNKNTGMNEFYFSAKECEECDSDLYYTFSIDTIFAKPIPVDLDLNSEFDEIQPRISRDGKKLLFASKNNSYGKYDIFLSQKNLNGIWTYPVNLGDRVNSLENEDSPTFGRNNEIYFASNGYSRNKNYDVYRVNYDYSRNEVEEVLRLPDLINTNYDEKSYNTINDDVIYTSNRLGNYDLFREFRCMNAFLSIELDSEQKTIENTQIIIKNEDGVEIINEYVNSLYNEYNLMQNNIYEVEVKNDCINNFSVKKLINIPCDDIKNLVYNYKITLPSKDYSYDIEEVNIPFFVTGYYYPNTTKNLNELKLLFKENRFSSDSTSYVEEPGEKYEKYALEIDKAFNSMENHLKDKFSEYDKNCFTNNEFIRITVVGFSDPRVIAKGMKYFGPSIEDKSIDLKISNADDFNNKQLSRLRAYHTANELKSKIEKLPNFDKFKNRIVWNINGEGKINSKDKNFDLSRRVMIKIETIPYESN